MHPAILFIVLWALAFVTLAVALVLLNLYYDVIGNDLALRSVGQEAALAGVASLIEGAGVWLVVSYVPAAGRALFVPFLLVAILYKLAHLEDWSRYDVLLFLMFQIVIGGSGAFLFFGHFQTALIILGGFGVFLAIFASIVRNL
jgi:hypothetical protein